MFDILKRLRDLPVDISPTQESGKIFEITLHDGKSHPKSLQNLAWMDAAWWIEPANAVTIDLSNNPNYPDTAPTPCLCGESIFWECGYGKLHCFECDPLVEADVPIEFWRLDVIDGSPVWSVHEFVRFNPFPWLSSKEGDEWT